MKADLGVRESMLAAVPGLRAFAMSLCGKMDRADDLVQETLLRALTNIDSFEPGTNMSAWLFTILRNLFRSEYRKRRREVEDGEGRLAESLKSPPDPGRRLRLLLRGGGADLWQRGWHHQEPGQSRAHAPCRAVGDRKRERP